VKSAFAFGLNFVLNDYYASAGPKKFFFTWGGLTLGVTMLAVSLCVWKENSLLDNPKQHSANYFLGLLEKERYLEWNR
jgi:hypothetical protein